MDQIQPRRSEEHTSRLSAKRIPTIISDACAESLRH